MDFLVIALPAQPGHDFSLCDTRGAGAALAAADALAADGRLVKIIGPDGAVWPPEALADRAAA